MKNILVAGLLLIAGPAGMINTSLMAMDVPAPLIGIVNTTGKSIEIRYSKAQKPETFITEMVDIGGTTQIEQTEGNPINQMSIRTAEKGAPYKEIAPEDVVTLVEKPEIITVTGEGATLTYSIATAKEKPAALKKVKMGEETTPILLEVSIAEIQPLAIKKEVKLLPSTTPVRKSVVPSLTLTKIINQQKARNQISIISSLDLLRTGGTSGFVFDMPARTLLPWKGEWPSSGYTVEEGIDFFGNPASGQTILIVGDKQYTFTTNDLRQINTLVGERIALIIDTQGDISFKAD